MILVAEVSYSTAKKGATVTDAKSSYIWPDAYIWIGEVTAAPRRTAARAAPHARSSRSRPCRRAA